MKFEIGNVVKGFYICVKNVPENWLYLREEGNLSLWDFNNKDKNNIYFKTKEKAQAFLDSWLPRKEWLTTDEVKAKSEREALDLSIEHWKQICVADFEDLYKARQGGKVDIDNFYCALCQYHKSVCSNCILNSINVCCCKEWKGVNNKSAVLWCASSTNQQKLEFKKACINMLNRLINERNKMKTYTIDGKLFSEETIKEALKKHCGFEKKEETKTLRHGDFGYHNGSKDDPCIVENDGGELHLTNFSTRCNFKLTQCCIDIFEKVGNVFDILERVANNETVTI